MYIYIIFHNSKHILLFSKFLRTREQLKHGISKVASPKPTTDSNTKAFVLMKKIPTLCLLYILGRQFLETSQ